MTASWADWTTGAGAATLQPLPRGLDERRDMKTARLLGLLIAALLTGCMAQAAVPTVQGGTAPRQGHSHPPRVQSSRRLPRSPQG